VRREAANRVTIYCWYQRRPVRLGGGVPCRFGPTVHRDAHLHLLLAVRETDGVGVEGRSGPRSPARARELRLSDHHGLFGRAAENPKTVVSLLGGLGYGGYVIVTNLAQYGS
jgi:hypothetical protein